MSVVYTNRYTCDRCGHYEDIVESYGPITWSHLTLVRMAGARVAKEIDLDLCIDCESHLREFLGTTASPSA